MRTEKIKGATEETAGVLHNGVDAAEEKIEASLDAVSANLRGLETELRAMGDDLLGAIRDLGAGTTRQVRAHPLAAFGIAVLAGIAVAQLIRR